MKHFKVVFVFLFTIFCTLPAFAGGIPELKVIWNSPTVPTVAALSFAPDDSYIVSLDGNGVLRFYTANNCDTITSIFAQDYGDDGFHTLNFSNDGKYLLTNSGKRFYQFDAKTFKLIKTFGDTTDIYLKDAFNPGLITFSSDGQYVAMVAVCYNYDSILVYNINTGKKLKTIQVPLTDQNQVAVNITGIGFSLDNKYLLVNCNKVFKGIKPSDYYYVPFEFAYSATTFEMLGNSGTSNIPWLGDKMSKDWSIGVKYNVDSKLITVFKYPYNEIIQSIVENSIPSDLSYGFTNDSKYFIFADNPGRLEIIDLYTSKIIANFNKGSFTSLHLSNNNQYFVADNYNILVLFKFPWNTSVTSTINNDTNILYPNPSDNILNIKFDLAETDNITAYIFDTKGNQVSETPYRLLESGKNTIIFDTSKLTAGAYILRIKGSNFSSDYKFTVVR